MRTIESRNSSRRHRANGYGRDEFNTSGMEDSMRNEDYYFNRSRRSDGYRNRDYNGGNYWAQRDDVRDERYGQYSSYVPDVDYGYERGPRRSTSGYGNQGSAQMRDFEHWREAGEEEGYQGRNRNDYRNDYGDSYQYNPRNYDRGGYRRNDEADNYNRFEDRGEHWHEQEDYGYGDYQSYPAYESRGYRHGEYDPRSSSRFRNDGRASREFGRAHRPYIREKRY